MDIQIRNAVAEDLPFVASLYADAVAGGHFWSQTNLSISQMLRHWLVNRTITRQATRQDGQEVVENVPIDFSVGELNGERAGFLITSPKTATETNIIEIYLLAVSKPARRQGVAQSLIDYGEKQYPATAQFYARCYPKSTWAISLFKKKGYMLERVSLNSRVHYFAKSSLAV